MIGNNDYLTNRIRTLEREVERLKVKESPIMSNYLLTTGKASDSDKLDGVDSTGFATAGHDHSGVYLPIAGKAADSDKLDNIDSTGFVQTSGNQTVAGIKTFSSIPVLPASNPTTANQAVRKGYADATYLGITAKAADADKLDGLDSTAFVEVSDPIGFWIPPAAFANVTWIVFGNNRIHNFVDASLTAIDTFISIPVAGKRLELTALMTSNTTGNIDIGVELRYLQEAGGQPSSATLSGAMLFTISPAFAVRKITITLDTSGYAVNSTFALRMYRNGSSAADTNAGPGYFFGISGRWID